MPHVYYASCHPTRFGKCSCELTESQRAQMRDEIRRGKIADARRKIAELEAEIVELSEANAAKGGV